jgi:alpha-beta hydrolase superfamily lysophospholipase
VLCHGLPATRSTANAPGYLELAQFLSVHGQAALVFNFEGCGSSGGILDLRAWQGDLELIMATARQLPRIDPEQLHLVGFSAGGAIAARVAAVSSAPIESLLLLASPARLAEILPDEPQTLWQHFAALGCVPEALPADLEAWYAGFAELDTASDLARCDCPLGLIHGAADETVPCAHAARLFAAAAQAKELKILKNAGHRLRLDARVPKLILSWLETRWKT